MRYPRRFGSAVALVFAVSVTSVIGLYAPLARAAAGVHTKSMPTGEPIRNSALTAKTTSAPSKSTRVKRYFVEFRARNAASYGHLYVLYGEVNARHEIVRSKIAGFFPAGDARNCANCSVFYWTIGHLIFVPSELGVSDGDLEEKYVLARYRVWIDANEYVKLAAYIQQRKDHKPLWNALWKNCVDFGRDVAEFMHLKVPSFIWMEPKDFVVALRDANGVTNRQLPLKDAAVSLPAPVRSVSPPPSQKLKVQLVAASKPAAARASHASAKQKKPAVSLSIKETVTSGVSR